MARSNAFGSILVVLFVASTLGACAHRSSHQLSRVQRFADDPHVALDGNGHGAGIWTESDEDPFDPNAHSDGGDIVFVDYDAATGFAEPIDLYAQGVSYSPRVGLHGDASVRAAWLTRAGTDAAPHTFVYAATRIAGVWNVQLLVEATGDAKSLSLAANRHGDALLAWWAEDQVSVSLAAPGQPWSSPIVLGGVDQEDLGEPALCAALSPDGDGVVARTIVENHDVNVYAHPFRPGANPPVDPLLPIGIGSGFECTLEAFSAHHLAAVIDSHGGVTVAWITPGVAGDGLAVNRFDPVLGWQQATTLVDVEQTVSGVFLGCDLSDARLLQWTDQHELLRATGGADGSWSAPTAVGSSASWTALAVAPNGCAITTSERTSFPANFTTLAGLLPPGGGWVGPLDVAEMGRGPDVAIEESGLAIALSLVDVNDPLTRIPELAVIATIWQGPDVRIADPPLATPGVAEPFDARASSPRTPDATIVRCEWDFDGDGTIDATFDDASGLSTSHVFDQPGTFTTVLRLTDSWGEVASGSATVEVGSGGDGPPWRLLVTESGGSGSVRNDIDGDGLYEIDCPSDCEASYGDGAYVYLQVAPASGFAFDHWDGLDASQGDMDYGVEGCVIHMLTHRTVTAVFKVP
jgi:hypothetical protein